MLTASRLSTIAFVLFVFVPSSAQPQGFGEDDFSSSSRSYGRYFPDSNGSYGRGMSYGNSNHFQSQSRTNDRERALNDLDHQLDFYYRDPQRALNRYSDRARGIGYVSPLDLDPGFDAREASTLSRGRARARQFRDRAIEREQEIESLEQSDPGDEAVTTPSMNRYRNYRRRGRP